MIPLAFTREGESAKAAIRSALADVKRAIPSARLIEAGPDLVGLSDVAALVGVTRQNMRKLMLAHRGSFPAPVHESSAAIWHLADLLTWLAGKGATLLIRAPSTSLLQPGRSTPPRKPSAFPLA